MAVGQPSTRYPALAGLRSFVVPGWGELSVTGSSSGRFLVLLSLVMANVAVGGLVVLGPWEVLSEMIRPAALLTLLALNFLLAVARLVSTVHAWRLAGGRRLVSGILLAAMVLAPHLAIGWLTIQVREMVTVVFSAQAAAPQPMPPIGGTSSTTTTTTLQAGATVPAGSPSTLPPPSAKVDMTFVARTTPGPIGSRLNVLILGGDAGPGRGGLRTDTVMVASIDTVTGDTALFGLPRNLGDLRLSDGSPVPGRMLNEVYGWANRYRADRFPGDDPGAVATAEVASYLTGLRIDYFVLVDLTGFADVVDAFGGVTMNVPTAVYGPLYNTVDGSYTMVHIEPGKQTLDGDHALAYARARYGSNDYVRMARQRCILAAMAGKFDLFSTVTRLPGLLGVMERNVTTNLPVDFAPELVRLGGRMRNGDVRVIGFGPDWSLGVNESRHLIPDVGRIREAVNDTIRNPSGSVAPSAGEACA